MQVTDLLEEEGFKQSTITFQRQQIGPECQMAQPAAPVDMCVGGVAWESLELSLCPMVVAEEGKVFQCLSVPRVVATPPPKSGHLSYLLKAASLGARECQSLKNYNPDFEHLSVSG